MWPAPLGTQWGPGNVGWPSAEPSSRPTWPTYRDHRTARRLDAGWGPESPRGAHGLPGREVTQKPHGPRVPCRFSWGPGVGRGTGAQWGLQPSCPLPAPSKPLQLRISLLCSRSYIPGSIQAPCSKFMHGPPLSSLLPAGVAGGSQWLVWEGTAPQPPRSTAGPTWPPTGPWAADGRSPGPATHWLPVFLSEPLSPHLLAGNSSP